MPDTTAPSNAFETLAVIGAGTMGHGIAQVAAMAGMEVMLFDLGEPAMMAGLDRIHANLDKGVDRGKVTPTQREQALERIAGTTDLSLAVSGADLVIEAVPEKLAIKQALFADVAKHAPAGCVYGTNTSSLSIAAIASAVPDPSRVVGLHFFNPVHIMKLLEVITHEGTDEGVLERIRSFGAEIGKECIYVRDLPGFATSRLGVALGMEAIRMLEQGVASAEDIDAAMVLGYRHPVGPLKLTDMVGLDVRMHIGEYLAEALDNPAFQPPELMREMVSEGKLGKKTGQGFYSW
jgi:3-hydroxybutyryl-CoA dehydrogenase